MTAVICPVVIGVIRIAGVSRIGGIIGGAIGIFIYFITLVALITILHQFVRIS